MYILRDKIFVFENISGVIPVIAARLGGVVEYPPW